MHLYHLLPPALLHALVAQAEPIGIPRGISLAPRALPIAPSGSYAPAVVPCPAVKPTVRTAGSLSPNETAWLKLRRKETVDPMIDFLKRAKIADFDAEAYVRKAASNISALPNIAIALSGGGYRALMNGAGFVAAADSRTPGATGEGGIGGLLQASTYLYAPIPRVLVSRTSGEQAFLLQEGEANQTQALAYPVAAGWLGAS